MAKTATCQATKSETSRSIFPHLPSPSLYSVIWLVHLINCLSCDWPEQSPLLHFTYDSLSLDNRNRLDFCLVKCLASTNGDWSDSLILRHFTVWLATYGNTSWHFPALCDRRVFTLLVIKQIGFLLRGRLILFITRMITERIELHSLLLLSSTGCPAPLASMVFPGSQYSNFTFNSFTVVICENKKRLLLRHDF